MSALIIDFAEAAARRNHGSARRATLAAGSRHPALEHDFMFWTGLSGTRYVHTVYSLIECPEMPPANIVLVRTNPDAAREAIHVMRVEHDAPSLNLAEVRMTAAQLGASEIHVHLLAGNAQHRLLIERDLAAVNADQRATG